MSKIKKILSLSVLSLFIFVIQGCGSSDASKQTKVEDVLAALKADGLPIGDQVVYTAENDPNKMLGRPGQYTGKANFIDTRVELTHKEDIDVGNGGSVEVFSDDSDAEKRHKYVSSIAKSSSMFNEYDYLAGNIVLRVSSELTPDQAAAYEAALKKIK